MVITPTPLRRILAALRATRGRALDVLGVGEISHDLVLQLPSPLLLRAPLPDKLSAHTLTPLGGGQIATAMVAARRLGLCAGLCGAVGEDAVGREQLAELAGEGVELRWVAVCPQAQTRLAMVLVDEQGDRRVLQWRHPQLHPRPDEPSEADLLTTRAVHLDGTYPQVSLRTAERAKAAGALVSIDLDHASAADRAATTELIALADLCVVSSRFPAELVGEPDADRAALALAGRTAGFVAVTRGEAGGVAVIDGVLHRFPALPPPTLVDTTACGDTFHAALLAYLMAQADQTCEPTAGSHALAEAELAASALRFACAAAALKCRDLGRRGCPTRAQVLDFLQQKGTDLATAPAA